MPRGLPVSILYALITLICNQSVYTLVELFLNCVMQWRVSLIVLDVDIGTLSKQDFAHLEVALHYGKCKETVTTLISNFI